MLLCLCSLSLPCVQVLKLFPEDRVMVVKGCIPGKKGNYVEIVPAKDIGVNVPSH